MPKKPPVHREASVGDSRRVEQFLAKAGPLIAAHRGLTPACRRQLTEVARGLGLGDQQMADALRSFQGGSQSDSQRKPPPLPQRTDQAPADPVASGQDTKTPAAESPPTPPPAPAPPPSPDAPGSSSRQPEGPPAAPATRDTDSSAPSSRGPTARGQRVQPPSAAGQPATNTAPVPPPPPEPLAPPAPPGPKPHDAFCTELRRAFAKVGKEGALSEKAERKLAYSGKTSFNLSEIYARHLVYEVATDCGVPVVSLIRLARLQQSSDDDQRDAKFREFLDRVTPIIAEQRGINVRSRVKMGAVARELGLSDEDVEQALKSLQKAADTPEQSVQWLIEREEAYRERLLRRLERRAGSVLTFTKEREYIEDGVDRYGVTEAFVRETLRGLMAKNNIRYVSAKQAREHVSRLVDERIGTSQRIVPHDRRRLQLEGGQWGLSPDEVDDIIREKHVEIGDVARSRQVRNVALLVVAAMLVVGVAGGLAALVMYRSFSPPPVDEPPIVRGTTPDSGETPAVAVVPQRPRLPDWWDGPLTNYIVQAGISSPQCADALKRVRSDDPAVRGKAYTDFVRQVPDPLPEGAGAAAAQHVLRLAHLEGVLTGCYALDPDDEAAACLRGALLACVPPAHGELPNNTKAFRKAFWAARVCLASLNHENIKPERAADLSLAIGHAVGATLQPSDEPSAVHVAGLAALSNHLYRLLIASAPTNPSVVLGLHTALTLEAARYLDAAKRLALDTDLLVAALPAVGSAWRDWEKLMVRCISSRDPANVLRIVDVYERLDNQSLQNFLRQPLLIRSGVRDADTVEEVASRVRRALGGSERTGPRTVAQRRGAFQRRAETALANLSAGPDQPDQLLTEVVRLQHASTLGCALAQQELGFPTFDEINGRDPESLISARTAADGARPMSPRDRRDANEERAIARLTNSQLAQQVATLRGVRTSGVRRASALRWLASMTTRLPDVDPKSGDSIGQYLLLLKTTPEHEQIAPYLKALCRWKSVRLGLANHIEASRLRTEHRQEVMSAALGREVTFDEDDNGWGTKMRRTLLLSVINELAGAAVPAASAPAVYDRASNLLHDYYTVQARLYGVLPAKYMVTDAPAAVLALLIDQAAADLSGRVKRPADRQYLNSLPHQLTAANYVGRNNLARTLLLERIWLRLLAADVVVEHPDRAAAADQLVAQLGRSDAASKHILTQLRDGHETILKMWQLSCEP